jgi:NTE family protein
MDEQPRCRPHLPVSVLLGAGAVRGLAHVAVLRALIAGGFQITELVGTSVGAIVTAFYGAVGLDLDSLEAAGLALRSQHLLSWAILHRIPPRVRDRYIHLAGDIPAHLGRLRRTSSSASLHHGLSRIGIVSYDLLSKAQVVWHNERPIMPLDDAVLGAAAMPGLFRPLRCSGEGGEYLLIDAGARDRLPAHLLFTPPFQPVQVLAVDVSKSLKDRTENLAALRLLRRRFPDVPIDSVCVDTLNGPSVVYRSSYAAGLLDLGHRAGEAYLSRLAARG